MSGNPFDDLEEEAMDEVESSSDDTPDKDGSRASNEAGTSASGGHQQPDDAETTRAGDDGTESRTVMKETNSAQQQPAGGSGGSDQATESTSNTRHPAFSFDATTQGAVYPRSETWDAYEDFKFEVEMFLRREHDIKNAEGREFDDLLLQLLIQEFDPEAVAEAFVRARQSA